MGGCFFVLLTPIDNPDRVGFMFRVAKQNRIFQDIVDQIQEAILTKELKPGEMLPPERDLKDMFKTSRGTLREALRVLEQKGLIEIRLGVQGGAVVKEYLADQVSEGLDLLIRYQKVSLDHLAEFREGVEGTVASLAAQRAEKKDIEQLEDLLSQAGSYARAGASEWDRFLEVDKKIHQAFANITGNPIYILVHRMVHNNIHRYYHRFLPPTDRTLDENYGDLCQIVEAVKENRATEAKALARRHVRRFSEYMIRTSGQQQNHI